MTNNVTVKETTFAYLDFMQKTHNQEGLVFCGCQEPLSEWVKGITEELIEINIITVDTKLEWVTWKTSGGRTDLMFWLTPEPNFDIGRLAMWRIQFVGACSWLSDYCVNYRDQQVTETTTDTNDPKEEDVTLFDEILPTQEDFDQFEELKKEVEKDALDEYDPTGLSRDSIENPLLDSEWMAPAVRVGIIYPVMGPIDNLRDVTVHFSLDLEAAEDLLKKLTEAIGNVDKEGVVDFEYSNYGDIHLINSDDEEKEREVAEMRLLACL